MPLNAAAEAGLREPKARFTKVYPKGWHRLQTLLRTNPIAARVWSFLVEHVGHDNALVCTSDVIAEGAEISVRSVFRAISFLEKEGAVVIVKIGPGANCYILDPSETWKTYEEHKHFCAFSTKTLASKRHNPNVARRIKVMMEAQEREPELFAGEIPEE